LYHREQYRWACCGKEFHSNIVGFRHELDSLGFVCMWNTHTSLNIAKWYLYCRSAQGRALYTVGINQHCIYLKEPFTSSSPVHQNLILSTSCHHIKLTEHHLITIMLHFAVEVLAETWKIHHVSVCTVKMHPHISLPPHGI
jgi:hypothetical protein